MAIRTKYANSNDIGIFAVLTNTYCLVADGGSSNFYSTFQHELEDHIPVVQTTISGSRTIGCFCLANSNGLLLPSTTTDKELKHLRNSLPDNVAVRRLSDSTTSLGNCGSTNDYVCLIHPELDRDIEEIIADTLGVEVFRQAVGGMNLTGSYSAISNVHTKTTVQEMDELSSLLQISIVPGTVNGSNLIGAGMVVNDWIAFTGMACTATEIEVIDSIFKLHDNDEENDIVEELQKSLLDTTKIKS